MHVGQEQEWNYLAWQPGLALQLCTEGCSYKAVPCLECATSNHAAASEVGLWTLPALCSLENFARGWIWWLCSVLSHLLIWEVNTGLSHSDLAVLYTHFAEEQMTNQQDWKIRSAVQGCSWESLATCTAKRYIWACTDFNVVFLHHWKTLIHNNVAFS